MTLDDNDAACESADRDTCSDVILCVAVLLLSLGLAAVAIAYLFPYSYLTDSDPGQSKAV